MENNALQSIRYLMDEMDPSERIKFEDQIKQDADLLIEVESMRQTLSKSYATPVVKTPGVCREVLSTEIRKAARRQKVVVLSRSPKLRAAALIAALGFSFIFGMELENHTIQRADDFQISTQQAGFGTSGASSNGWVDKNNVLNINTYNAATEKSVDSVALQYARQLKYINKTVINQPYSKELLLTRTSR